MEWQRPVSVPFPTVWKRHLSGHRALSSGRIPTFRIEDASPDMFEDIIEHMCGDYMQVNEQEERQTDELMCKETKMINDTVSINELKEVWRKALNQRVSLVGLSEEEDGNTKFAGVNILSVSLVQNKNKKYDIKGSASSKLFGVAESFANQVDEFTMYGVSEYLVGFGLSVAREFRGQGLAEELLKARVPLCRALSISLTCTTFSSTVAQNTAAKAGFECVAELKYEEHRKNGELVFPNLKNCSAKRMTLQIK